MTKPLSRRPLRTNAERMADGECQFRAVQRIEMKFFDALFLEQPYLFYCDAGCNELASLGIVFKAVEAMHQPFGHARTALLGKSRQLWKSRYRQDAGDNRRIDARSSTQIPEAHVCINVEKELRDCTRRPGIELALQFVEIELRVRRFRVIFGICWH